MSSEAERTSETDSGAPTRSWHSSAMMEALPALVWAASADGARTEYANRRWLDYTGRDITLGGAFDLVHAGDRPHMLAEWNRVCDGRTPFEMEYRLRRSDGAYRWHAVRAVPRHDEAGRLEGWYATALDIEEHRRDEASFRVLAQTVPQLVWIARPDGFVEFWNERLCTYSGVRPDFRIGYNWTSLVHPHDVEQAARLWYGALETATTFELALRLRRHDGIYRWFLARAVPVANGDGEIERYVGTATDIHDRQRAEISLSFLDRVSDILGPAIDVRDLQRAAECAVPALVDWCSIWLRNDDGAIEPVAIAHRSPELVAAAWRMLREYPPRMTDPLGLRVLAKQSLLFESIPREEYLATAQDARHLEMMLAFEARSAVVAPIVARGIPFGAVHLVSGEGKQLGPDDLRLAQILGKRLGVAIENAHIYERERHISSTFQQAALSHRLPVVPGLDLHAVYVAAEREAEIGGDWYDAFALDDGRIVISIGDVAGKGLEAAVLMGSLRQAIRVVALKNFSPAEMLEATSRVLQSESVEKFATAFVAVIDPATWSMRYATAAHPLPLLRRPDGSTFFLQGEPAPPLGLIAAMPSDYSLNSIPPDSLLVLYTDGLVESTRDIFAGEERLRASVSSQAVLHSGDPARLIRDTVLHDGVHDDVAVLTVAFGRSKRWSFDARDAMSAHGARSSFLEALRAEGSDIGDYIGSEVIFGELIGNVVRHAPGPIDVTLDWSGSDPVLHVIDRGPGFTRTPQLPQNVLSESGRGLFIIDTLAREFSAAPIPGRGTHVTVRLPVERRATS